MERLQKVIANSGYCSRRKAEDILKNKVKVDGVIVNTLGTKVDGNSNIEINGKTIKYNENKVYYLLNKPRSVISSSHDDKNRTTVIDLIKTKERIYPIGRLDYDTTGLIILTNDGELTNYLMHPSNEIEKTYLAKVEGLISKEAVNALKHSVNVEDKPVLIKHFKVHKVDKNKNTTMIEVTIVEGRNHIVKKIFSTLGYPVIKLTRIKYAFLDIEDLKSGEYRELTIKEVKKLYALK